ncbi:hydrogenase small subunit [Thermicanus aegyptius]|uniref:hydrogenase small subunit n=1 Tax=Thermicanus aegyptius TaxID=94009 RepID=UPI0012EC53E3|nr:hydrogenase small subunit [Thermicanus aegyptius]
MGEKKSVYDAAEEMGIGGEEFLNLCTSLTFLGGMDPSMRDQMVKALKEKPRVPVIWMQFQDCTGCTESFIRSTSPGPVSILFDLISLDYTEVLSAAAGEQAEASKQAVMEKYRGEYLLAVEGSIPEDSRYLMIGGRPALEIFQEAARGARAVIAYGSCSSWGGIAAAFPNPTGARPIRQFIGEEKPVILVPGCPPIAEVMVGVIAYILATGELPELDRRGRPKIFYRHRIHEVCDRRPAFDQGLFAESFDDEGAKAGYCLFKLGCRGTSTFNSCAELLWNGGTGFPIQAGNICLGCSEENFWDKGSFFAKRTKVPGKQTTAKTTVTI